MNKITTVFDETIDITDKIFVWFTDKFLSGWGCAKGRIHKQVIICDDFTSAERIYQSISTKRNNGACFVNYGKHLPNMSRYSVSYRLAKDWTI